MLFMVTYHEIHSWMAHHGPSVIISKTELVANKKILGSQ